MIRNLQSFCIILHHPYFLVLCHVAPTTVVIALPHTISKVSPFLTDSCGLFSKILPCAALASSWILDPPGCWILLIFSSLHQDLKGAGAAAAAPAPTVRAAAAPTFTPPPARVLEDFHGNLMEIGWKSDGSRCNSKWFHMFEHVGGMANSILATGCFHYLAFALQMWAREEMLKFQ